VKRRAFLRSAAGALAAAGTMAAPTFAVVSGRYHNMVRRCREQIFLLLSRKKLADLPVGPPTGSQSQEAKALGLTIPAHIFARTDEVSANRGGKSKSRILGAAVSLRPIHISTECALTTKQMYTIK
jgi:hypothetical protein